MSATGLRMKLLELVDGFVALSTAVEENLKLLEEKERNQLTVISRIRSDKSAARSSRINLNVGGQSFAASRETFLRWEGSYFHHLVASDWKPGKDGEYFIDRDPQHFGRIMACLRSGEPIGVAGLRADQVAQLRIESDYYQLPMNDTEWLMNNMMAWNPDHCSFHLMISEEGRTVEKVGRDNLMSGVLGKPSDVAKFQVRVRKGDANMYCMIGYSTLIDFSEDTDYDDVAEGYFLDSNGALWEPEADCYHGGHRPLKQGDLVAAKLNKETSEISFSINGANYSTVLHAVMPDDEDLVPCIRIGTLFTKLSLEDLNGSLA